MAPPSPRPATPARLGSAIHRSIAEALRHSESELARHRHGDWADRTAIETATAAYLGGFHPGSGWRLFGSEVRLGTAIADLVFESTPLRDPGRTLVLIDELKTTASRRTLVGPGTLAQLDRLLVGGRERWGNRLFGVRLVAPACRVTRLVQSQADLARLQADLA